MYCLLTDAKLCLFSLIPPCSCFVSVLTSLKEFKIKSVIVTLAGLLYCVSRTQFYSLFLLSFKISASDKFKKIHIKLNNSIV